MTAATTTLAMASAALAVRAETPLFASAHQALTFAFNCTKGTLERPMMSRMADKMGHTGRGLGGLDGAAQAAMIQRKVRDLDPLHQQIILAKFLPRLAECRCCGGDIPDQDWLAAIRAVSNAAMDRGVFSGHLVHRSVRDGVIQRYFGRKVQLGEIAAKASISINTVTDHNSKVVIWLRGSRVTKKKGGDITDGIKGEEARAMEQMDALLTEAGTVGAPA